MHLIGSCLACGPVLAASHLAGELVRGCRLALAGPSPCTTHEIEPAATSQESAVWFYRLNKRAAHPCKDLHTSRTAVLLRNSLAVCSLSSCKNRRRECPLAPQRGREAPEGAVFCALRNLALPPECLCRSIKCAAFDADLVLGTGTLPVGWVKGGRSASLIPTAWNADTKKPVGRVRNVRRVKKFPALCYSPIVKFTVPSPLEPLTTVFGKGTCVSAPP